MAIATERSTPIAATLRRWAALAALASLLVACSGGGAASPSAAATDATETEAPAASESAGASTGAGEVPAWCGTKEIRLSVSDGFGGNNWRRITSGEAESEAKKCPNIVEYIYTDGQGDTQKSISDLNGLAAQGVDAMVVFPDASEAMLPAIRDAFNAGSVVVPYRVSPGGEPGVDYNQYISTDFCNDAKLMAAWLQKALPDGGKVVYLGGPAGNSQSTTRSECLHEVLDGTNIELIGEQPFEVTNWDPAETQRVITAALAKFPQIDGWATDFGAAFASSLPAFDQANREVGPVATEDSNAFGCASIERGFPTMTVSSQNWMSRTAVQWAVALAADGTPPESTVVENYVFDDSIDGEVHCDPDLPGDAILSSQLTKEEMQAVLE